MLTIRVLGELQLELDGTRLEPPASRRARSLLGLLALDRQRHSRSRLATTFWPDVLDESARTSLRGVLSAVRRSLGPDAERHLVSTREDVMLGDDVRTDTAVFEELVADGRLADAVKLWRGDLLAGLEDDWVLAARDEWRERMAGVLEQLAAEAPIAEAIAITRRIVALDPLAEEPQRALMRRLAEGGEHAAALRAYTRYTERLRTELRIAPSSATRTLAEEIRASGAGTSPPADAAPLDTAPTGPRTSTAPSGVGRPSGTVTLLFTDHVGSTALLGRLGEDAADQLRQAHFALTRNAALNHGGTEVKSLGDGLMLAFGSAADGARCAIVIQQECDRHNRRAGNDHLRLRIGLHVGEPIHDEGDYFGAPVVVASRLCDRADGGQILTSELFRLLVGEQGGLTFEAMGDLELKGLAQPVTACELSWETVGAAGIAMPAGLARADGPLIGRGHELAALEDAWQRARAGESRVVLVAGNPGIGKTRLVAELCRQAHGTGATVLLGRAYEDQIAPYQPFVDALRQYVASCAPDELTLRLGTRRHVLGRLVPELAGTPFATALTDGNRRLEGEGDRFALFDAVASLIAELARSEPTILVLDDLHWADDPSLLLLRHVVRASADAPLLILGTYRDTELHEDGPLSTLIAELRRGRAIEIVPVAGLGAGDVAALIRGRGADAPDELARAVARRTEGNPFFVEEIVRHLEAGRTEFLVPDSVKDLVRRRLRGLGEPARDAIRAAAVLGREFDLDALEAVTGSAERPLLDALDEAVAERVLVESRDSVGRYLFAHALVHETVYEQISAARRSRLHRRAGEALAELYRERPDDHAGQLAHHFVQAGDDARSLDYQLRAARAAARIYATQTAVLSLSAALETGERLGLTPQTDSRLRHLLLHRGWLRHVTGQTAAGIEDYQAALEAARAAGGRWLEASTLDHLAFAVKFQDIARATRLHEEALAIAEEIGAEDLMARLLSRQSLTYSIDLDLEAARRVGDRAQQRAQETGSEGDHALAADAQKLTAQHLGELGRLESLTSDLEGMQRRQGDLWYLQWTVLESSFVPLARADWHRAGARLNEALAINHRIEDVDSAPLIHDAAGWLARSRGDYGQALAAGRLAVELTDARAGTPFGAWTRATLGWTLLELRASGEAITVLEPGAAEASTRIDRFRTAAHLAWAATLAGDDARAAAQIAVAEQEREGITVPEGGAWVFGFGASAALARAHLAAGSPDSAEALIAPIGAAAAASGWREAEASSSLVLGLCQETRAQPELARAHFVRAIELADEYGLAGVSWEARASLAGCSDEDEAARLRADSAALVQRLAAGVGVGDARIADGLVEGTKR